MIIDINLKFNSFYPSVNTVIQNSRTILYGVEKKRDHLNVVLARKFL